MPVTTGDWLRLIESISSVPSDRDAVVRRLQAARVDGDRAEWLLSLARRRRIGRRLEVAGCMVVAAAMAWLFFDWYLALSGSPAAPGMDAVLPPCFTAMGGGLVLMAGVVTQLATQLDLFAHPRIPADLRPPPRPVRVGGRYPHILLMFAGIVCIMMAGLSVIALPHVRNATWLGQRGVETSGVVVSRNTWRGTKGGVHYDIRYRFPGGDGDATVSRARYDATKAGDPIAVTFLPSRPEINAPVSKRELVRNRLALAPELLFGAAYVVIILVLVLLGIQLPLRRLRRLAERGVAVLGRVTEARPQRVAYLFPTPSGEVRGFVYLGKRRARGAAPEGTPLTILYDPENPRRNVALGALEDFELG